MCFNTDYLYTHIKGCWVYKPKCHSGKKHVNMYIWWRNSTLKSLRSSTPTVCYQLLLNYISCAAKGKAAVSIKATVSYPHCLCPSPSLWFYLIGLVTRGKKSFYLWSPTVTVAKIFVISRQDYCHRQNLELHMKIRLKFQAMNTMWLPVFSVTYAIVSLLGPCSHPSNFTLLKTWFPTFKIIKYVILTPKTMTFYITLILTLPSSMPSKIF